MMSRGQHKFVMKKWIKGESNDVMKVDKRPA